MLKSIQETYVRNYKRMFKNFVNAKQKWGIKTTRRFFPVKLN